MTEFIPLFAEVVQSSLWRCPASTRVVFLTMLVLRDEDHVCRMPDHKLYLAANVSAQEFKEAISALSSPDPTSEVIEQEFDGRRIERVEGGWKILNGEKYQEKMEETIRRRRWARAQRKARRRAAEARQKPKGLAGEAGFEHLMERGVGEETLSEYVDQVNAARLDQKNKKQS